MTVFGGDKNRRVVTAILTVCLLTAASVGCGSTVSGDAQQATAKTTLDVGNYPSTPGTIGNAKSNKQARARESQRLGDYVVLPFEADPTYTMVTGFFPSPIVLNRKGLSKMIVNDTFDDVAKDLTAGWVNSWSTGDSALDKGHRVSLAVLMFPDAATAAVVGPTLEHDDFTYNSDNEPVQITKYPGTTAHWRPGISSIGSWTVHDRYVVFIKLDDETHPADLPSLTGQVERMLEVQLPLLDKFTPTPTPDLPHVALDVDGLLGRTLPSSPDNPTRAQPDGVFTGRGVFSLLVNAGPATFTRLDEFAIDLISFGESVIFRSRTQEAAERHFADQANAAASMATSNRIFKPIPAPPGLGQNVACYAIAATVDGKEVGATANYCGFQTDRYYVEVESTQVQDLYQQVNAQYAMLTGK
ncbi:hypothetical protein ACFWPK_23205 [Nocardia sp. NPDC058519]|uniref:DUF7373 family lipoprotein n=1 Tax=Nocardia sp. NPDC058519 TaxID=3346535 RepID=UPI003664692D